MSQNRFKVKLWAIIGYVNVKLLGFPNYASLFCWKATSLCQNYNLNAWKQHSNKVLFYFSSARENNSERSKQQDNVEKKVLRNDCFQPRLQEHNEKKCKCTGCYWPFITMETHLLFLFVCDTLLSSYPVSKPYSLLVQMQMETSARTRS